MLKNFRTYQIAKEFVFEVEQLQIKGELKDQLWRASTSIVLNLAKGSRKMDYPKDKKRFYNIALGSLREAQSILEIPRGIPSETVDHWLLNCISFCGLEIPDHSFQTPAYDLWRRCLWIMRSSRIMTGV